MKNIILIISNTVQKELRSKTLIFLSIMTIGVIIAVNAMLSFLSDKVLSDFGLGQAGGLAISGVTLMIGMWCYFLCSYLIIDTIRSDLEKNVTSLLMTLPIKRVEYLLGRIFGVWIIVACFYLITSIIAFYLFNSTTQMPFSVSLVYAYFLNLLSYLGITSIGLLIAMYFNKLMALAVCMVSTFFIHGSNTYFMSNPVMDAFKDFEILSIIGGVIHQVLPRIGVMSSMAKTMVANDNISYDYGLEFFHYFVSIIFLIIVLRFLFCRKSL